MDPLARSQWLRNRCREAGDLLVIWVRNPGAVHPHNGGRYSYADIRKMDGMPDEIVPENGVLNTANRSFEFELRLRSSEDFDDDIVTVIPNVFAFGRMRFGKCLFYVISDIDPNILVTYICP